jgi:hypothetical protein
MNETSLREAFTKIFAAFGTAENRELFLAFFDERAMFVDEDNPVPMDKAGFVDHLDFRMSGVWESVALKPWSEIAKVFGTTGLVTGHFTLRGKPKSAGFRQRHGNFSLVCAWDAGRREWRGVKLHLSPLQSHIHHASPA